MKITQILWDSETIQHIARHYISPEEVEEMLFSNSDLLIEKAGENIYLVSGQTESGRYLFTVVKTLAKGKAKIITSREMTYKDKKHYKRKKP